MRQSIVDAQENISFNLSRWGNLATWESRDHYGYQWADGLKQSTGDIARLADRYLRPHLGGRYDHTILEIAPGAGRFTAELIRYASRMDLLDISEACLDICRERFKYYPVEIGYFLNDGVSCDVLGERTYNLIASYDSMVHMHPEIIAGYVFQLAELLEQNGVMWLDHSGDGAHEIGHRTDMTAEKMADIGALCGLKVVDQSFRNLHDCITVFAKRGSYGMV